MADIIESETRRLLLRQWKQEDFELFAFINSDKKVMAFYPSVLTRDESDVIANKCKKLIESRGWGFWALELKSTGQFIGFTHIPI